MLKMEPQNENSDLILHSFSLPKNIYIQRRQNRISISNENWILSSPDFRINASEWVREEFVFHKSLVYT